MNAVPGWHPVVRVSALVVRRWTCEIVRATRWETPTGVEGTVLAVSPIGRLGESRVVPIVSSVPLERDLGLSPERCVLDPQVWWADSDGHQVVTSPALGVRISVPADVRQLGGFRGRERIGFAAVTIEEGPEDADVFSGGVIGDWQHLLGRHPGAISRWPLRARAETSTERLVARPPRLATGPAPICRDRLDESVGA